MLARIVSSPRWTLRSLPKLSQIRLYSTDASDNAAAVERDSDQFDVVIVGAGPSGLSAAIRLKQLGKEKNKEVRVCVVEKGAEVGSHILSGAVIEPRALTELIPNWKELGAPLNTKATNDKFYFLMNNFQIRLPTPPQMNNHGNYIISLGNLTRWLGKQAEELGVEIYPGFAASEVLYNEDGSVKGIATSDVGVGKNGKPKDNFARGMELHARLTLFAEGCRGSLTKTVSKRFDLQKDSDPQSYGLGIKEVWQVPEAQHKAGTVVHTIGWPFDQKTYGGSFIYHMEPNLVSLGLVVGLDYPNPYLNPYREFQRFKHHPLVRKMLEGGTCVSYGARTINEGGLQAIPKLAFPGGALIGCSAGFVNVPKIKGSHTAMKSGMLAAESAFEAITNSPADKPLTIDSYQEALKNSWIWDDLYPVRNLRPSLSWGLIPGIIYSAIDTFLFRGKAPWTFRVKEPDHKHTKPASEYKPIEYPKNDGVLSFDLLTNVQRSGTNHEEDQPPHLKVLDKDTALESFQKFKGLESRYCPAGVYEWIADAEDKPKLQINAQNCVHCKTCDIKDPKQNIRWTVPEGGGGPAYANT